MTTRYRPYIAYDPAQESTVDGATPTLTEKDKVLLNTIHVGCLTTQVEVKEPTVALNYVSKAGVRLENRPQVPQNYMIWAKFMEAALNMWLHKRVYGIVEDKIEGSIEAYRRYYGTPPTDTSPAMLCDVDLAKEFRQKDIGNAAMVILSTVSTEVMTVFLASSVDTTNARSLWQGIRSRFVPRGAGAKQMASTMLAHYNPGSKGTEAIIQDIRQLYLSWELAYERKPLEEDMAQNLIRHLPKHMDFFRNNVRLNESELPSFDDLADRAIQFERTLIADDQPQQSFLPMPAPFAQPNFRPPIGQAQPPMAIGFNMNENPQYYQNGQQHPPPATPYGRWNQNGRQNQPGQRSGGYQGSPSASPTDSNGPRTPSPNAPRSFPHITCHKCGKQGHYANQCPDRNQSSNFVQGQGGQGDNDEELQRRFAY
ncbi:unnamed protein product [Parajaminaea phylloscopi]